MLAAVINLLFGIWSGLIRIGWEFPLPEMAVHHGAIMVGGFLTTLISLEKVIPLRKRILFFIPVLSSLTITIIIPGCYHLGLSFLILGGLGFLFIQLIYLSKYPKDLSIRLMLIGALALIIGDAMLIYKQFYPAVFPWWMAFLLLTITSERLELTKFLPVSNKIKSILLITLVFFLCGILMPFHSLGKYVSAFAVMSIALWMLLFDIIRIGVRKSGLTGFSAWALLLANTWLLINGLLFFTLPESAYSYDILLHTFFIGYVFSMIFAHGPIILPVVLGIHSKPFHRVLYVWLGLLNASLLIRIFADAFLNLELRKMSGFIAALSILLYFISLMFITISAKSGIKAENN